MNRLDHLKQTLLQNILDNHDYQNIEFILLDYNSQDGMESWVKNNLSHWINTDKLIYYKTTAPSSFNHSHAKNLMFKLATGDILCNVNADHFLGKNFAFYVNQKFQINPDVVITPIARFASNENLKPKDVLGKVCVKKKDFLKIKGFDERMLTYGFEDFDFVNRLEMIRIKRLPLQQKKYLKYLSHSDEGRFSITEVYSSLQRVFIGFINYFSSYLIYVYNNGKFELGKIIDNSMIDSENYRFSYQKRKYIFEHTVERINWIEGCWVELSDETIRFNPVNGRNFDLLLNESYYTSIINDEDRVFKEVTDVAVKEQLMNFHYLYKNRKLLELNLNQKILCPNREGFGQATVFKNFDMMRSIKID